jgi:hypothetical protein
MSRILTLGAGDPDTSSAVVDLLTEDLGYEPEEAIPIAVRAIFLLSQLTTNPQQAMDEVASLVADPEEEEVYLEVEDEELLELA